MKLALFWNYVNHEELEIAAGIVCEKRKEFLNYFQDIITVGIFPERETLQTMNIKNLDHKITCKTFNKNLMNSANIINAMSSAFQFAKEQNVTFGIFSYNPAWILDPSKLLKLLEKEEVQSKAFSVRLGNIAGKSAKFSPKLPFIDDNFIIFNVKKCDESGIFVESRLNSFTSHFEMWGGNHAVLLSFFEACIPYGDIFIYSDGKDCQGLYGEFRNFYPDTYLFSHNYGFLSINSSVNPVIHALRAEHLHQLHIKDNSALEGFIKKYKKASDTFCFCDGIPFLKKEIARKISDWFLQVGNRYLNKINFEFLKRYDKPHTSIERKSG